MLIFRNREHAGRILAEKLLQLKPILKNPIVLAIPRGGVPIGFHLADALNCPFDVLVLRKLPLPQNDQMGFGAVTLDKKVILNEYLINQGYVNEDDINLIVDEVYKEVLRRNRGYRGDKPFPNLKEAKMKGITIIFIFGFSLFVASLGFCNPVAIWLFDEGKGDVVKDSSGSGNNGKITGTSLWVDGKFGKALYFDGGAKGVDYITVPDSDSLDPENAITMMAWVKLDQISGWKLLFKKEAVYEPTLSEGKVVVYHKTLRRWCFT